MTQEARCNAILKTDTGTPIGIILFDSVSIVRDVETFDTLVLSANPNLPIFDGIPYDGFIDKRITIERAGIDVPYLRTESEFFIRHVLATQNSISFTGYSAEEMLSRRIIAYAAGSTDAAVSSMPADDLMKFAVTQNLGSGADADRQLLGLVIEPDTSLGANIDRSYAHDNVLNFLDSIREYTRQAGAEIFFRMQTLDAGWNFRTFYQHIGLDRRDNTLNLSEENENFQLDGVGFDAENEVTYMYVGGAGLEAARIIGTASDSARIGLSAYNRREAFYNASQEKTQAGADDVASQELSRRRARRLFSGTITERANYRYGIEWDFGDLLRAEHRNRIYDVMVRKVQISITPEGEQITAYVEVE